MTAVVARGHRSMSSRPVPTVPATVPPYASDNARARTSRTALRLPQGAARARIDLRFGYSAFDLSGFPPGTTLYLCGAPAGRVVAVRAQERCGSALAIASVRVVPGSEREEDVVWAL